MATVTNYDLFEDLFYFIKQSDVEISDVIKEHGGSSLYIPSYKTTFRNCWDAKNLATECIHTWPADAL